MTLVPFSNLYPVFHPFQDCRGRGPGFRISDFESNFLIGKAQATGAQAVMSGTRTPVTGSVRSVHQFVNMFVIDCRCGTQSLMITMT